MPLDLDSIPEKTYISNSPRYPLENLRYENWIRDKWTLYFFTDGEIDEIIRFLSGNLTKLDGKIFSINTWHFFNDVSSDDTPEVEFGSFLLDSEQLENEFSTMIFSACRLIFPESRQFIVANDFSDYFVVGLRSNYRFGTNGYKFSSQVKQFQQIVDEDLLGSGSRDWLKLFFSKYGQYFCN